jgi:hypothetical protein
MNNFIDEAVELLNKRGVRNFHKRTGMGLRPERWEDVFDVFIDFKMVTRICLYSLILGKNEDVVSTLNQILELHHKKLRELGDYDFSSFTFPQLKIVVDYLESLQFTELFLFDQLSAYTQDMISTFYGYFFKSIETDIYADKSKLNQYNSYWFTSLLVSEKYEDIIEKYKKDYLKFFNQYKFADKNILTLSFLISKIQKKDGYEDIISDSLTISTILSEQYYLWLVKDDLKSETEIFRVAVLKMILDRLIGNKDSLSSIKELHPKTVVNKILLMVK